MAQSAQCAVGELSSEVADPPPDTHTACIRLIDQKGRSQIFSPHWNPNSSLYRCVESKAVVKEYAGRHSKEKETKSC